MTMSTRRATITYTAPPAFLATEDWKQIYAALLSQLPLRNLHWKSAIRPNIRTIQELDVSIVSSDSRRDEHTQIPQPVLEKPLLNAYIVTCDDAETYKNTIKKKIKDWHTTVSQRKNQEWLIIHVVHPDSKTAGGRLFQMKTSVLDKIKADFNQDKKDRCVQLAWSYEYDNPTAWAELINKVKEGILSAFDAAITQREEEVKRSESQRQMPGWNFCTFFILKESLASSFEGMNLYDEALDTYHELEVLFFDVLKEKNLSWFGNLITPSPKDDSLPLLSSTKKPYRDLILANTITIFDFRTYLLARQCAILNELHRLAEVAQKSITFLGTFSHRLREIEDSLPRFFVESWTYSSAMSVVEQCDTWAKGLEFDKSTLASFNALKGELVEIARHQLDVLGVQAGHLPPRPPFNISLVGRRANDLATPRSSQQVAQGEVLALLRDKEAFYSNYVKVTNRAIELYATAGRRKFALKMHGSLAALDVFRGRLANALQTFSSLPAHYSPHNWSSLETYMLSQALDLHTTMGKARDRDWVYLLLDFLKAYIQDMGRDLLLGESDHVTYVAGLVQALSGVAREAPEEMTHHDHPALVIAVLDGEAKLAGTRDGAILDVSIRNLLPCPILLDELSVALSGREGSKITFTQRLGSLNPGKSNLSLFCPSAAAGTYSLHSTQAQMSNLIFQWVYAPPPGTKHNKGKRAPILVRVPKDLRAVDVRLRQPRRIELGTGTPPCIVAGFSSGRNDIVSATLRLSAPSGVTFHCRDSSFVGQGHVPLEANDDNIVLADIPAGKTIFVSIPHSDASAFHAMRVNITVDYTTATEPDLARVFQLVRFVLTALPVAINVEDFFRGTRLFTRFTLSSTSPQHVRILRAELLYQGNGDDGLKITRYAGDTCGLTTITPTHPGRYVFQLDSMRGEERDSLRLQITYRMLREEVECVIEAAVDEVVSQFESFMAHRSEILDTLVQALEQDASWVALYEITGELIIPGVTITDNDVGRALIEIKKLLNQPRHLSDIQSEWREIVIPVDIPQMHIVAAASLHISSPPNLARSSDLFAGQPIDATLIIHTSFHWAPPEDSHKGSYRMFFDVEEMPKDWLVSGQKKGDFVATDGSTFTSSITLIALHHGELYLPKIAVTALPMPGEHTRMKAPAIPSCETHQVLGARNVLVLPRGGRSTFVVSMGEFP